MQDWRLWIPWARVVDSVRQEMPKRLRSATTECFTVESLPIRIVFQGMREKSKSRVGPFPLHEVQHVGTALASRIASTLTLRHMYVHLYALAYLSGTCCPCFSLAFVHARQVETAMEVGHLNPSL